MNPMVLYTIPPQPALSAFAHISYPLATTDDERKNGFSHFTPQNSIERSVSESATVTGSGAAAAISRILTAPS